MKDAPALVEIYRGLNNLSAHGYIKKVNIKTMGDAIRELFIGKLLLHITIRSTYESHKKLLQSLNKE